MSNIVSAEVYKTLAKLVKGDVANFVITIHNPNKKGEGYLGEMLYITLKCKKSHNEFNIIVKQAFKERSIRESLPIRDVFMNEIYFYTTIWPTLDKFQAQIPAAYRFQKIPKCLTSTSSENCENLVMENLKFQNFHTLEKKVPLNKTYYELILKEYGKFHGISFAYKALHPEEYAGLANGLMNIYRFMGNKQFFQNSLKYSYEICSESLQPGVDDAVIEKFLPYVENCKELFLKCVEDKSQYTVLTHGDCWSNNMMFKHDDAKSVTDVRFLDFQLARDASPCCDLSYCIYSGASKEVLQNLDYYLQVYHDSLSKTLKEFGCDSAKLYPFQELKKDWKRFYTLGFSMSLLVWKMKFTYDDQLKDFTDLAGGDEEQIFHAEYDKEAYREVAKNLLYHLYEYNLL